MLEILPIEVRSYVAQNGKRPFIEWLASLKDKQARHRIQNRLDRLSLGNRGDHRSLGDGVFELKIDYGPGYRMYFGEYTLQIVVLLLGGDKKNQDEDIKKAKKYWRHYLQEKRYALNRELS